MRLMETKQRVIINTMSRVVEVEGADEAAAIDDVVAAVGTETETVGAVGEETGVSLGGKGLAVMK